MEITPDAKYYPLARRKARLGQKRDEEKKLPRTPEELVAEAERFAAEHRAAAAEMEARGDFKDFDARWNSAKTDEERAALAQEHSYAISQEVMFRRAPEIYSLIDQFFERAEQD